jgi:isopentenyldiphosphate isomerase
VKIGIKKERNQVHIDGDWHKVVQIFIISDDKILLQQRSLLKKDDPNKWCASSSGHISAGEESIDAAYKELNEELGINLDKAEIKLIDTFKSPSIRFNNGNKIINNHFVDLYVINKQINIEHIEVQKEEVNQVSYFNISEFINMVNNNDERLIDTPILFEHLIRYITK